MQPVFFKSSRFFTWTSPVLWLILLHDLDKSSRSLLMSYLGCSFIWLPCCLSPSPRYILLAININTIKHTSSNGCVDCKTPKTLSEWGMRDALRIREYPLNSSNPAAGDPWLQEVAEGLKVRWPTRHCWREYKDEGVCNKLKAWEISSKHQPLFIDGLGTKFEFLWIFFLKFLELRWSKASSLCGANWTPCVGDRTRPTPQ